MAKTCLSCGTQNEDSAVFCDNCGSSLPAAAAPSYMPPAPSGYAPSLPPAPSGSVICPACGHPGMVGEMFCDNCGASLAGASSASPFPPPPPAGPAPYQPPSPAPYQPPAMPSPYQPPAASLPPLPQYQPPYQSQVMGGRLMVGGAQIPLPQKTELTVGRPDLFANPPWQPDVDLTPYGGGEPTSGVSRRHAKLTWQGVWYVEDLGSINGVYVRGQKIFQRTPLSNGDQITLGRLILTFYAS